MSDCKCKIKEPPPNYGYADLVNHPPHYTTGGIETIDFLEAKFADDPWLFSAVQYLVRARHKGQEIQDLEKAIWYVRRKIEHLKKEGQRITIPTT